MVILRTLGELLLCWLTANACHRLWIGMRLRRWEQTFIRDAHGLRPGVSPYTVGTGPVALLCVHGFADSPAVFRRMAQRLADTGHFTCRAMRLPGAGEPIPDAARVTLADLEASVHREVRDLQRCHAQVWVVGHSMGASLALQVALDPASHVAGVVLLTPLLRVSRRRSPVLPPSVWFRLASGTFRFSRTFESCFAPSVVAKDDPAFIIRRDRFIPFHTYEHVFALIAALAPRAPALHVPVFAALAANDRVVDTPAAQQWLAGVPAVKVEGPTDPTGAGDAFAGATPRCGCPRRTRA
jgi:pimeloyl-ACP methyl ester carboxylesterase